MIILHSALVRPFGELGSDSVFSKPCLSSNTRARIDGKAPDLTGLNLRESVWYPLLLEVWESAVECKTRLGP